MKMMAWPLWILVVLPAMAFAADEDAYLEFPKQAKHWQVFRGELGSDTIRAYQYAPDKSSISTISVMVFDDLFNGDKQLAALAPELKTVLKDVLHKGDVLDSEKRTVEIFGVEPTPPEGTRVVFFEFKRTKASKVMKAGVYQYYYITKPMQGKVLNLAVQVVLKEPGHRAAIDDFLKKCVFVQPAAPAPTATTKNNSPKEPEAGKEVGPAEGKPKNVKPVEPPAKK